MRQIVVVGGSIAAATAASTLRLEGFDGRVVLVSAETESPYSRVPLSKGVLAGTEPAESARLPALPDDVDVRLGVAASALDVEDRVVHLANGHRLSYDGLVVATGARARHLAETEQSGELCLRDLADATHLQIRAAASRSAVVVGGGFLGMELASTLLGLGLEVALVARVPPLSGHLGGWLSTYVRDRAVERGLSILLTGSPVRLVGDPVRAVDAGTHGLITADMVITAVGDRPNIEWLQRSGLPLTNGLVGDESCSVARGVAVAGDVSARGQGGTTRSPHWANAVVQGAAAARSVLGMGAPVTPDPYFWTEQFGLDIKISGALRPVGRPEVIEGDPAGGSSVLRWRDPAGRSTAVAINHRLPIVTLKRLGARAVVTAS